MTSKEMLDIYDENGNRIGVRDRESCHVKNAGVYHKAVWIWVVNSKREILVQKKSMQKKKNAGKWDMPIAGHVDAGETCLECCVREAQEELGLNLQEKDFIFLKEFKRDVSWEFSQVYLLKTDIQIEDMKLQLEEVEQVKWLNFQEFEKLLFSEQFCNHNDEYKIFACDVLKTFVERSHN